MLQHYFHDGSIIQIDHQNTTVRFSLESAEVINENDLTKELELSTGRTLTGILHLHEVRSIYLNEKPFFGKLRMRGEIGDIRRLEINENEVQFFVQWMNYFPKPEELAYSDISIKMTRAFWENRPIF